MTASNKTYLEKLEIRRQKRKAFYEQKRLEKGLEKQNIKEQKKLEKQNTKKKEKKEKLIQKEKQQLENQLTLLRREQQKLTIAIEEKEQKIRNKRVTLISLQKNSYIGKTEKAFMYLVAFELGKI